MSIESGYDDENSHSASENSINNGNDDDEKERNNRNNKHNNASKSHGKLNVIDQNDHLRDNLSSVSKESKSMAQEKNHLIYIFKFRYK